MTVDVSGPRIRAGGTPRVVTGWVPVVLALFGVGEVAWINVLWTEQAPAGFVFHVRLAGLVMGALVVVFTAATVVRLRQAHPRGALGATAVAGVALIGMFAAGMLVPPSGQSGLALGMTVPVWLGVPIVALASWAAWMSWNDRGGMWRTRWVPLLLVVWVLLLAIHAVAAIVVWPPTVFVDHLRAMWVALDVIQVLCYLVTAVAVFRRWLAAGMVFGLVGGISQLTDLYWGFVIESLDSRSMVLFTVCNAALELFAALLLLTVAFRSYRAHLAAVVS